MRFLAGQYLEFLLSDGKRRPFSIANAPRADGVLELHVRKVAGGGFTLEDQRAFGGHGADQEFQHLRLFFSRLAVLSQDLAHLIEDLEPAGAVVMRLLVLDLVDI